jgi:sigma-E factor negative regulatory protein RseC
MTREEGIVIKTDAKTAWIKTVKTDACASCSAKSSCHTLGGGKEVEVEAINTAGARIGDRVVIGFETAPLLKATFLIYIFPILGLLLGAFIGQTAAPLFALNPSAASIIVGFLFLFLALWFIKQKGNRLAEQNRYRPKVVRILIQAENGFF